MSGVLPRVESTLQLLVRGEVGYTCCAQWQESDHPDSSDEEEITRVHAGGPDDIDDAVKAARQAFRGPWSLLSGTERAALMHRLAELAEQHTDTMATIDSWNNGQSSWEKFNSQRRFFGWD